MPIDSSKFFDSIRIKPNKLSAKQQAQAREAIRIANGRIARTRARTARRRAGKIRREYWHFCLDHVREYNQSYNFFQGMNPDAVARYQKDALTGHRPTWKMGANTSAKKGKGSRRPIWKAPPIRSACSASSMAAAAGGRVRVRREAKVETRKVFNAERKALQVMGLGTEATLETSRPSTRRW